MSMFSATFSAGFGELEASVVESEPPEQALSSRADRAIGTREPRSVRRMTSSSEASASSLKRAPLDRSVNDGAWDRSHNAAGRMSCQ